MRSLVFWSREVKQQQEIMCVSHLLSQLGRKGVVSASTW